MPLVKRCGKTKEKILFNNISSSSHNVFKSPVSQHYSNSEIFCNEFVTVIVRIFFLFVFQIKEDDNNTNTAQHKAARVLHCANFTGNPHNSSKPSPVSVRWSLHNDVMYCPIYKVGTTFWRRVFMIQREEIYRHLKNPFDIAFDKEYKTSVFGINDAHKRSKSFKFLFTRNPYSRLYSTYVDKLLAPNPLFWKAMGESAIRLNRPNIDKKSRICGHDVTFPEFIKYVIFSLEHNYKVDPHFIPMERNCQTCAIKYDFVGRMENFEEDSLFILKKLKLNKTLELLESNGNDLAADDAIRDTLKQPFTFRWKYIRCMSFYDALQRAWTKLKLRGLIGNDTLKLDRVKDSRVTFNQVLKLARVSRSNSRSEDRRNMKENAFLNSWRMVPLSDKIRLRTLYSADFLLFNYNDTPENLFRLPGE